MVRCGGRLFKEEGPVFADPGIFEMFSFPAVAGDLHSALDSKNKVVLTRQMAEKYFGHEDPIGRLLTLEGDDFTVTGVVEVPANSSIRFNYLLSNQYKVTNANSYVVTYVELVEGVQPEDLERRFAPLVEEQFGGMLQLMRKLDRGLGIQLGLQPLRQAHLAADFPLGLAPASDPVYSYVLGGISLAVLLIACINFTNLSLGLASTRFREVSMRKVLGSTRQQLLAQFCGEAVLLSLVALILGLALAELVLPLFCTLSDRSLSMDFDLSWLALVGLVLVAGLAAGAYPALSLSRPHPVEVFRGKQKLGGANWFSRALRMLQFAESGSTHPVGVSGLVGVILRNEEHPRRTNTYAKSIRGLQRLLDVYGGLHNFVRIHFTTREVPAVALGIIERGLSVPELFQLRRA